MRVHPRGLALLAASVGILTAATLVSATLAVTPTLTISPDTATIMASRTKQYTAVYHNALGATVARQPISWSVSDGDKASISSTGLLTSVDSGTVTVLASTGSLSALATITVTADTATALEADTVTTVAADTSTCSTSYTGGSTLRTVNVTTRRTLLNAMQGAKAGDLIKLADSTYPGTLTLTTSGTARHPIVLCGSRRAVITTNSLVGMGALDVRASYWVLDGMTVRTASNAVMLTGANHVTIRHVDLHDVGQQAVLIRGGSSDNTLEHSRVRRTGRSSVELGQGVRVGSPRSEWCRYSACGADQSDSITIRRNAFGPAVTAVPVELREGSSYALVSGNTFSGDSSTIYQTAWVNVYGNNATVAADTGATSHLHGMRVAQAYAGWGAYNAFADNFLDLGGATGYGISVGAGLEGLTTVACSDSATNAGSGLSNVICAP